jgi:hypothetical protein
VRSAGHTMPNRKQIHHTLVLAYGKARWCQWSESLPSLAGLPTVRSDLHHKLRSLDNSVQGRDVIRITGVGIFLFTFPKQRVRVAQLVYCLTTDWTSGRSGFDSRQGQRIFPVTSVSRPALRPTHPPVQWILGVFTPGQSAGGT